LSSFESLNLIAPLLRAVAIAQYDIPTPIQIQAIPPLLEGRDVLGCAQTGTGKTAAFALPILQLLVQTPPTQQRRAIRALVLTPTRELAAQIGECFATYGQFLPLRHRVIFGGVGQGPQVSDLRRGVDILVATPGRLLDLASQGHVDLSGVAFFVLDEADRMLDMGFIPDIRRVLRLLPVRRQNLLFSATLPSNITALASDFLSNPIRIEVSPPATPVDLVDQRVLFVEKADKSRLLANLLANSALCMEKTLVFTRTKHGADRLTRALVAHGFNAAAIHGNKSQGARERALHMFQNGELAVLIATDVASRGIDVDGVTHVVNFDLPNEPESYVHRIGRTARAGKPGTAFAFCQPEDRGFFAAIERLTSVRLTPVLDQPYHCEAAMAHSPVRQPAPAFRVPRPTHRPFAGRGLSSRWRTGDRW
jgi:ATP-dependent RNA helicase RhlE